MKKGNRNVSNIIRCFRSWKRYNKKEIIKRMKNVISLPSFTSKRTKRGEEEGIQYHFITKEQFKEK